MDRSLGGLIFEITKNDNHHSPGFSSRSGNGRRSLDATP